MKVDFTEDMKEIYHEFIIEADEILENLDHDLVGLEENRGDKELLNKIFRSMHTLKGGAGFLGLSSVVELSHRMEDIFNKLRNDEIVLSSSIMDVILEGIDTLKSAITTLKEHKEIPEEQQIASILDKLSSVLNGDLQQEPKPMAQAAPEERVVEFVPGVDLAIQNIIRSYPGYDLAQILDEIILLPPEKRDMDLVMKLDSIIAEGKDVKDLIVADLSSMKPRTILQNQKPEDQKPEDQKPEDQKPEDQTGKALGRKSDVSSKKEEGSEVIRVDVERVEMLMNLVGELVLDRNRIIKLASRLEADVRHTEAVEELTEAIAGMNRSVSDLQDAVMKLRMQPVGKVFGKFPRIVRDLAKKLGKNVQLELEGEDTEIDRSILGRLEDPLIHLIRNAIDHGIESVEERARLGKNQTGIISLTAYQEGDRIAVAISDDGRGIDTEIVKRKAIDKGIVKPDQADAMSDKEVYELIFLPGFSTAKEVSDVSGRGVGMDVVASTIHALRGSIEVESELGEGTRVVMKLPLTVAIIRTLMVGVNGRIFAIPLYSVVEIAKYNQENVKHIGQFKSLMLRDEVYLLFGLGELFDMPDTNDKKFIIIANIGERNIAIAIDELYGEEEIVIKPLGELLNNVNGVAGATITGDGRVVLIMDINTLVADKKIQFAGAL